MFWVLSAIFGYSCGSIPFGLLFTRLFGAGDIRAIGSGNIGATNVLRTGRKGLAAATLIADALKGTIPVLIARQWSDDCAMIAGFCAFLGHIFPIWLGFKGGKGVATFLGVALALDWRLMLVFVVVWVLIALATRYSSLAALVASAITPIAAFFIDGPVLSIFLLVMTIVLWLKHKDNIARLRAGEESRIGRKEQASP